MGGKEGIKDFQIGIITSDADAPNESGQFQAKGKNPKLLRFPTKEMALPKLLNYFVANVIVGSLGSTYEKHLEAMQKSLSPPAINKANKGFLRKDAILALFFLTEEDDCSHNGKVKEEQLSPTVCRIPKGQTAEDGSPGQMHNLIPPKTFITFLRSLQRRMVAYGLIGDPEIRREGSQKWGVIEQDKSCPLTKPCAKSTLDKKYRCIFTSTDKITSKCGGCTDGKDRSASAFPGFRIHEVIKGISGRHQWSSSCEDSEGYEKALIEFAHQIQSRFSQVLLSKVPSSPKDLQVYIIDKLGKKTSISQAQATQERCVHNSHCAPYQICGPKSQCHGNGWVYFPPEGHSRPRIKLSGASRQLAQPETTLQAAYFTK